MIAPLYQSATTPLFSNIVATGNKPNIFGTDGIGVGSNGSWFAAFLTFTSIAASSSRDQFYNTGVLDLTVTDFVAVMNAATAVTGIVFSAIPASAGFYVRCNNNTVGAINPGAVTINCLVMKVGAA